MFALPANIDGPCNYENVYFSFQNNNKKKIVKESIRNPEALHFKSWAISSGPGLEPLFLLEAEK